MGKKRGGARGKEVTYREDDYPGMNDEDNGEEGEDENPLADETLYMPEHETGSSSARKGKGRASSDRDDEMNDGHGLSEIFSLFQKHVQKKNHKSDKQNHTRYKEDLAHRVEEHNASFSQAHAISKQSIKTMRRDFAKMSEKDHARVENEVLILTRQATERARQQLGALDAFRKAKRRALEEEEKSLKESLPRIEKDAVAKIHAKRAKKMAQSREKAHRMIKGTFAARNLKEGVQLMLQ